MNSRIQWTCGLAFAAVLALAGCGSDSGDPLPEKGSIEGTVVATATGAAISGASVSTDPATVTVTTDAAGAYALPDLDPGTYKVLVTATGFEPKERAGVVVAAGAKVTIGFSLEAVVVPPEKGKIQGTVQDADGAPIADATVTTDPATVQVQSAADGTYALNDLEPGTYTVLFAKTGFVGASVSNVAVTAGETATADVTLEAEVVPPTTGRITGKVETAGGTALAGATVTTDPATDEATTAADGTYVIDLVDPGAYTVKAAADGYVAAEKTDVVVVAGEDATANLVLEAVVTTGSVVVTVNDLCTTAPLVGATLARAGAADLVSDADGKATATDLEAGEVTFTVTASGFLPSEVKATIVAGQEARATVDLQCQSDAVAQRARDFLATVTQTWSPIVAAQAIFDKLNDGDDTNDPVIVSMRKHEDYVKGRIEGSLDILYKDIASDAAIATLGAPDPAKSYLAYCYTGHTGGIGTAIMNMLGYKTQNLKFGLMSWTRDETARVLKPFDDAVDGHDFPVETEANEATGTYTQPTLAFDGVKDAWEATKAAAMAYLTAATTKPTISAQELFDNLNDGDDTNDPLIVSVRKPEDYAKGHIPGAINILYTKIAEKESLAKLPTDRKIVIYCYTGHTGAIATGVLGALGYDVTNLKFGIQSWTRDATVRAQSAYNDATDGHDFPFVTGETL